MSSEKMNDPTLCANDCGFFGNPSTENFCSKCYRDIKAQRAASAPPSVASSPAVGASPACAAPQQPSPFALQSAAASAAASSAPTFASPSPVKKSSSSRCNVCSKKLTLAGAFACACSGQFCAAHRHAEQHACTHDFKTQQRAVLTKQNPVVIAEKLEKV